jgi:2-polyprenyl-6-methoxyphenol hydroxylase-like FAD-dependent oxidoreductase
MQPKQGIRVLVIGGGLGGLATAIGLRRAGIDVAVFDQAKGWEQVRIGGGMQLGANAMRAFRELGVLERVEAAGTMVERQELRAANGELLGLWPVADLAKEFGVRDVRTTRANLAGALSEAVDRSVVHFGCESIGYIQTQDSVIAYFADGREERGDVLIGADGTNSVIRAQLLGKSEPRYAGYAYSRGYMRGSHPMVPEGYSTLFFGRGTRFALYAVGQEQVSWFSVGNAPQGAGVIDKAALLRRHRGWAKPIEEVIEATDESVVNRIDIVDRDPVDHWGEGRVTLLGDAAHPMTIDLAQGACQTIEDAFVLSRCLSQNGDSVAALRSYEAQRIPRTTQMVKRSRSNGRMFASESPVFSDLRNRFLKYGGARLIWTQQKKIMSYDF